MTVPTTLTGTHDGCGGAVIFRPVTQRRELLSGRRVTLRAACQSCGETLSIEWSLADVDEAPAQVELPMAAGAERWRSTGSAAAHATSRPHDSTPDGDVSTPPPGATITELASWRLERTADEAHEPMPAAPSPQMSAGHDERDAFIQRFADRFEAARQAVRQVREELPNLPNQPLQTPAVRSPLATTSAASFAEPAVEPTATESTFRMPQLRATASVAPSEPAVHAEPEPEPAPEPALIAQPEPVAQAVADPVVDPVVEPVLVEPDIEVPVAHAPLMMPAPMPDTASDSQPHPQAVQHAIAAISADAVVTESPVESIAADVAVDVDVDPQPPVQTDVPEFAPVEQQQQQPAPMALTQTDIAPTVDDVVAAPVATTPAPAVPPAPLVAAAQPGPQPATPAPLDFPTSMLPTPVGAPVAHASLAPPQPQPFTAPAAAPTESAPAAGSPAMASDLAGGAQVQMPAPEPVSEPLPDFEPTRGFDWGNDDADEKSARAAKPRKQRRGRAKKRRGDGEHDDHPTPNDSFSEHATGDAAAAKPGNQRLQWLLVACLVVVLGFLTFKIVSNKLVSDPGAATPVETMPATVPADPVDPAADVVTTPATDAKQPAADTKQPATGAKTATGQAAPKTPAARGAATTDPLAKAASGAGTQDAKAAADTGATGRDPFATK